MTNKFLIVGSLFISFLISSCCGMNGDDGDVGSPGGVSILLWDNQTERPLLGIFGSSNIDSLTLICHTDGNNGIRRDQKVTQSGELALSLETCLTDFSNDNPVLDLHLDFKNGNIDTLMLFYKLESETRCGGKTFALESVLYNQISTTELNFLEGAIIINTN